MIRALVISLIIFNTTLAAQAPSVNAAAVPRIAFTIVACDTVTGDFGVGIVAANPQDIDRMFVIGKGTGICAVQGDFRDGSLQTALDLLAQGHDARWIVDSLVVADGAGRMKGQVTVIDRQGRAFCYTGPGSPPYAGQYGGLTYAIAADSLTVDTMIMAAVRQMDGPDQGLADRLIGAMAAAFRAGNLRVQPGEARIIVKRYVPDDPENPVVIADYRSGGDTLPVAALRERYERERWGPVLDRRLRHLDLFQRNKQYFAARIELQRIAVLLNEQLRMHPDDPDVLNRVAWILAANDIDAARGLELAGRASKLAPERLDLKDTMAECHFRLGHYNEAIAIERELVTKDPSNGFYKNRLQKFQDARPVR